MARSVYLRNKLLDAYLRGVSFSVSKVYVSLHTDDPGTNGANEAVDPGNPAEGVYARQEAAFTAASGGASSNDADVEFLSMPAGTYTHVGLWDALTGGNYLHSVELDEEKVNDAKDDLIFEENAVVATEV